MENIRLGIFETNSSSSHSISFKSFSPRETYENEYETIDEGCYQSIEYFVTPEQKLDFFERLLVGHSYSDPLFDLEGYLKELKVLLEIHFEFDSYYFAIDRPQEQRNSITGEFDGSKIDEILANISDPKVTCEKIAQIVLDFKLIISDEEFVAN